MRALSVLVFSTSIPAGWAQAQVAYPSKPARMILSYPPGGSTDVLGRMMAKTLSDTWPVPVIVENRPGAGGNIGTTLCVRAAPDGYTMCSVSPAQSVASRLSSNAGFDSLKDFSHVTLVTELPLLLLVHPSLPVKSVADLVALAKRRPGALNYASSGGGATPQLMMEMLKQRAGLDIVLMTYKGTGGGQLTDQLAGRVELAFNLSVGLMPYVRDGRLRPIAVSTAQRLPALPNVPTLDESGQKGVVGSSWQGIAMPAGVPRDIVHRVNADMTRALRTPEVRDRIIEMGGIVVGSTPEEFAAFFQAESDKWFKVARAANVTLD
ncbi:MAG: tripartite tricarboxylate transporter substrate binding protein [Proteobacteria bacterium]|nr:tripartite tricarboxylate transporter substrate binding protein [Burkholderiales bacterium]